MCDDGFCSYGGYAHTNRYKKSVHDDKTIYTRLFVSSSFIVQFSLQDYNRRSWDAGLSYYDTPRITGNRHTTECHSRDAVSEDKRTVYPSEVYQSLTHLP